MPCDAISTVSRASLSLRFAKYHRQNLRSKFGKVDFIVAVMGGGGGDEVKAWFPLLNFVWFSLKAASALPARCFSDRPMMISSLIE